MNPRTGRWFGGGSPHPGFWGCSKDSRIGREEFRGKTVVERLTEKLNLCSAKGLDYAKKKARSPDAGRTLLWCSIPCTGGSAINSFNPDRHNTSFKKKDREDRLVMKNFWTSFENVAHLVFKAGGRIAIEWPFNCAYWHDKKGACFR